MEKIATISQKKIARSSSYVCDRCSNKGDVFNGGILLCAICYLLEHAPERVDKLRRKIIWLGSLSVVIVNLT